MSQYDVRRDFNGDVRLVLIACIAAVIGAFSTGTAYLLLKAIRWFTKLFFFQSFADQALAPANHTLGAWVIAVPVIGGLLIGLLIDAGAGVAAAMDSHFDASQQHRAYPVTRNGKLIGIVDRAALEQAAGAGNGTRVGELFGLNHPVVALANETCRSVATRLAVHQLERLPVVDDAESLRLIGLVSRSDLIKATVAVHVEENHRQSFRRISLRNGSGQNGSSV